MCHHSLTTSGPRAMDSSIPAKGRASGQGRLAPSSDCAALAGVANAIKRSEAAALFFMNAIMCPMLHAKVAMIAASSTMARDVLQGSGSVAYRLPALRARRADSLFARSLALNLTRARAFHAGGPCSVAGAG